MSISRRQFICSAVAVAGSAALPAVARAAPVAEATIAARPVLPVWLVGTPGEWDYEFIRAATADEALEAWADYRVGSDCECAEIRAEGDDPDEPCERCQIKASGVPDRVEELDAIEKPTAADWIRVGYGANCDRCKEKAYFEEGARAVGDLAICEGCMTLSDWDIVDPKHAAELRADAEDAA